MLLNFWFSFHFKVVTFSTKSNSLRFNNVNFLKALTDFAFTKFLFKVMLPSFGFNPWPTVNLTWCLNCSFGTPPPPPIAAQEILHFCSKNNLFHFSCFERRWFFTYSAVNIKKSSWKKENKSMRADLKGQSHEIFCTRFFSLISSSWSY